jgi:phosphoglycerate dehydrogenase-like enzyme
MRMKIAFLSKTEINIRHLTEGLAPHDVVPCRSRDELLGAMPGVEVLVVQNQGFPHHTVDADCLRAGAALRLVQHHGVACDATDVGAATRLGIPVAAIPGQNSRSVAEHGFFLLLALARRARAAQRLIAEGRMGELDCTELAGKTLCLVGLGTIGKMLAAMARGFSMRVIGVRRNPGAEDARAAGVDEVHGTGRLREVLAQADFTVLVLPLNRETAGIIGAAEFAAMKRGAMLVNLSRGAHVDRGALEAALARDGIAGYATDAYWTEPADPADPLLGDERVIATPHMGGKSIESILRCVGAVRENVERVARGETPVNVVNDSVLQRA